MKPVLVTGTSSGIGRAITESLSEAEFRCAMDELMSKLVEVNRGSDYALEKEDIHTLLDRMWARSQDLAAS